MKKTGDYGQRVFPVLMALCLVAVSLSTMIYMAKDNVFSNRLYAYFNISPRLHAFFMGLPIGRSALLRIINLSAVCFFCIGLVLPLILSGYSKPKQMRRLSPLLLAPFVLQAIVFDPFFVQALYFGRLGFVPEVVLFRQGYRVVETICRVFNAGALGVGFILLVRLYLTAPRITPIRLNIAAMVIGLVMLQLLFLYMFGWAPVQQLWMSRVARITLFKPLPVGSPGSLNNYYPWMTLAVLLVMGYGLIRYLNVKKRIALMDWEFSRKVDVAETTVRAISHYMKNELLAIRSEAEQLQESVKEAAGLPCADKLSRRSDRICKICDDAYDRLNQVHRMTGFRRLSLTPIPLYQLVVDEAEKFRERTMAGIELEFPKHDFVVMGDMAHLSEVIHNLMANAVDATEGLGKNGRIKIRGEVNKGWVIISITDNGRGISEGNLANVFEPFFSTKPLTKNWGIGLALSKQIILTHNGKLEVESGSQGTTFLVALPYLGGAMG